MSYLSCGVKDIDLDILTIQLDLLVVRICFGRLIILHKLCVPQPRVSNHFHGKQILKIK